MTSNKYFAWYLSTSYLKKVKVTTEETANNLNVIKKQLSWDILISVSRRSAKW